ncbi:capsular biosynthesis protein CpsH, partial [Bacillus cereus]|nr:capsular biosynthesis protein CpsH [Bacillus cereus]
MFLVKVILLVLWIIFVVILEKVVRKKLNIPKQIDLNKYVNNAHKWGTR